MVADDLREVGDAILAAYDSGALLASVQDSPDGFKVRLSARLTLLSGPMVGMSFNKLSVSK